MATRGMTAVERRLWRALQRRVGALTPEMNRALLEAFRQLADQMSTADMLRALSNPDTFAETVVTDERFNRSMLPVRQALHQQVRNAVLWFVPQLPGGGMVQGVVAVGFNVLDPVVREAVAKLDSRVMLTLKEQVREGLRRLVLEGVDAGTPHRTIARRAREVVGLAPNQVRAVQAFDQALRDGKWSKALGYKLRDRRFDRTLVRLRGDGGHLAAEHRRRMVAAYRRKFLSWNAQVNARTAVMDAQRLGKHLAMQEAIAVGIIDGTRVVSTWVNVAGGDDEREERMNVRPLHRKAHGETVRFGEPFPTTGEVIPGESTFQCRCVKRDWLVPEAVDVESVLVYNALEAARPLRS